MIKPINDKMKAFDFYEHELNRRMRFCLYAVTLIACMAIFATLLTFLSLAQDRDALSARVGVLEHRVPIMEQQSDSVQVQLDAMCE